MIGVSLSSRRTYDFLSFLLSFPRIGIAHVQTCHLFHSRVSNRVEILARQCNFVPLRYKLQNLRGQLFL